MQPPTALPCPPSPAAPTLAEYVGGLFGKCPFLVTPQWSRLAVPAETSAARCPPCLHGLTFALHASMVSHLPSMPPWSHICPPCLHGLTSALYASMVSHLPSMPPWSHICRCASMVSHLPPCLNGLTFAALPRWSHICRPASKVTHLPPCLKGYTIPSTPHALTNCPATTSTPKAAFLRSRCSPWDLFRAFRVSSSSEPRSAVVAFMRGQDLCGCQPLKLMMSHGSLSNER